MPATTTRRKPRTERATNNSGQIDTSGLWRSGDQIVNAFIAREGLRQRSPVYEAGYLQGSLAMTLDDIQSALKAIEHRDHQQARATLERSLRRFAPVAIRA
mgnify:CR=1 FL=1